MIHKIWLGNFRVIEMVGNKPRIFLGNGVTFTINIMGIDPKVKVGDELPLFTEVEDAISGKPSIQ